MKNKIVYEEKNIVLFQNYLCTIFENLNIGGIGTFSWVVEFCYIQKIDHSDITTQISEKHLKGVIYEVVHRDRVKRSLIAFPGINLKFLPFLATLVFFHGNRIMFVISARIFLFYNPHINVMICYIKSNVQIMHYIILFIIRLDVNQRAVENNYKYNKSNVTRGTTKGIIQGYTSENISVNLNKMEQDYNEDQ